MRPAVAPAFSFAACLATLLALAGCAAPQGPVASVEPSGQARPPKAALGQGQGQAQAPGPFAPPDRTQPPWSQTPVSILGVGDVETGTAEGGAFWRLGTARGVVWVWRPAGYRAKEAGVCVYLHGYYTTVDQAVADHKLAAQFQGAGRNALFVVAESPAWNGEEGVWPDLDELLGEVFRRTGLAPARGPLVVVGHSGAFRPILGWLGHPRLEEVLLLDGLYRGEGQFRGWLLQGGTGSRRRLVLVSDETLESAEALAASTPGSVSLAEVPPLDPGLEEPARAARLVHLKSQHQHMAIVESGEVLPVLLRGSRLPQAR
jgi:hypothetical protein